MTGRPDVSGGTTPQAGDHAEAIGHLEEAMALIEQFMPEGRFKVSVLHRLNLYVANLRWEDGRRTCRRCGVEFHLSKGEQHWCQEQGYPPPTHCRRCRAVRRHEKAAVERPATRDVEVT